MKIKVLHCITDLSPDGAQRALLRLVSSMDKDKFDNQVVSLMAEGALLPQFALAGIEVAHLKMKRGLLTPIALFRFAQVVRRYRPHIIQGWMYHGNLVATLGKLFSLSKASLIWNIRRCLYDQPGEKKLTKIVINLCGLLSRFTKKVIYCVDVSAYQHEALGYDASKRIIIQNGFDTSSFVPSSEASTNLRAELNMAQDEQIVGVVGRYHPQKDFPTFLKAAHLIVEQRSTVKFVLAGRGLDEQNTELCSMIRELNLEKHVLLLGQRQDVPDIMPGFDLFCSSSSNEGFSNVVGEAMSSQVPCVVTDAGASRELVDGIGLAVERYNPPALAQAVLTMLALDKAELVRRGVLSRQRIVQNYSIKRMIGEYESLYENMSQGIDLFSN